MTDKTSPELKPCPFCGAGRNSLEFVTWKRPDGYVVACTRCKAQAPIMATKEMAAGRWNAILETQDHIVDANKMVKHYHIQLRDGLESEFDGWQRKDLDANSKNWHYYETIEGNLMHFRSEHMIGVEESEAEE